MKKLLSLMLILVACSSLEAQKLQVRVDSLSVSIKSSNVKIENIEESINGLAGQVDNLSYLVETQKEIISQEQSAIENSLGAVNVFLAVFALIMTIGGIFLGWFINRKERNVQSLLEQVEAKKKEVEKLEEKTSNIKEEVMELSDNINNGIEELYAKLRREETCTLLKRLVYEPEDITNILPLLLSRDLEEKDFKYVLLAYKKLEGKITYKSNASINALSPQVNYLVLFFQHFCGQAISHELVRKELIAFFPSALQCAFKRDVKNSTESLINCLNMNKQLDDKFEILYQFINALRKSKHKDYDIPYNIIVSKLKDKEVLNIVWKKFTDEGLIIGILGRLLYNKYRDDIFLIKNKQNTLKQKKAVS